MSDRYFEEAVYQLSELEQVSFEEAQRRWPTIEACEHALLPRAPRAFDANDESALSVRVLVHPVHGLGFPRLDPPLDMDGDWSAKVLFSDGYRELTGQAARWSDPRHDWVQAAAMALIGRVEEAEEEAFWALVDAVGWEDASQGTLDFDALGAIVRQRVSFAGCVAAASRTYALAGALQDRIHAWEESAGSPIAIGDDGFGDLTKHIVGCGRQVYLATMESPQLASERADAGEYAECFSYVFQHAEQLYSLDEIEAALGEHQVPIPPRPRFVSE